MNEQQPISPRRRQQELLAIPERQRTDAEWDELNELEITLASVNRVETREHGNRRPAPASPDRSKPAAAPQGRKPARKFHKRPPKGNPPSGQAG